MKTENLTIKDYMLYPTSRVKYGDTIFEVTGIDIKREMFVICNLDLTLYTDEKISECKLILRSIDSLTKEEKDYIYENFYAGSRRTSLVKLDFIYNTLSAHDAKAITDYFRSIRIDVDGFLLNGKAVAE